MTLTLAYDSTRGKATRTETRNLVPSQFTERHQAGDVPEVWPSLVERESAHPWRWVGVAALFFGLMCGGLLAPLPVQLAIGSVLVLAAGVVLGAAVRK